MGSDPNRFLFQWQAPFDVEFVGVSPLSRPQPLPEVSTRRNHLLWFQDQGLAGDGASFG